MTDEHVTPITPNPSDADYLRWLEPVRSRSADGRYRHIIFRENPGARAAGLAFLKHYARKAHQDAALHFARLSTPTLDPLGEPDVADHYEGYPARLVDSTLQGYLGEVMCGVIAENFVLFDLDGWAVPAFLFRYHQLAFDQLERMHRTGAQPTPIPGRFGDDCLAFHRHAITGDIDSYIVAEAKCTQGHSIKLIDDAHEQVSQEIPKGKDTPRLLEILKQTNTEDAKRWYELLVRFYYAESDPLHYNLVVYVYGRPCKVARTRISATQSHRTYTGTRELKAVEVSVAGVKQIVDDIYRDKAVWE